MNNIDALLGPKISLKTRAAQKNTGLLPQMDQILSPIQQQMRQSHTQAALTGMQFTQRGLTEEEKTRRKIARDNERIASSERKRQRDVALMSADEIRYENDKVEVKQFMKKVVVAAKKARGMINSDGTELPDTFVPDMDGFTPVDGIDPSSLEDMDKAIEVTEYYRQNRYPLSVLISFITRRGRIPLDCCELAFVVNGSWWRKRRFKDDATLRRFITHTKPERIDIGPTHPSSNTSTSHSDLSLERYLVFDVDLEDAGTDAPDGYIRKCKCNGQKSVCGSGCWFYMKIAVKCIVYLLRTVLGCNYILPVFSGRRGVHIWVLDERFLTYDEEARQGVVNIINQYRRSLSFWDVEHSGYIYKNILFPEFSKHFTSGQFLLKDIRVNEMILEMATGGKQQRLDVSRILSQIQQTSRPLEMAGQWESLCRVMPSFFARHFIYRLMFPRLDDTVTTAMNHCVKAPFVVHPVTKRASVPIPDIETWKPEKAPRISQLVDLDEEASNIYGWKWKQQREDSGAIMTSYVNHVQKLLIEAYPYTGYTTSSLTNNSNKKGKFDPRSEPRH